MSICTFISSVTCCPGIGIKIVLDYLIIIFLKPGKHKTTQHKKNSFLKYVHAMIVWLKSMFSLPQSQITQNIFSYLLN